MKWTAEQDRVLVEYGSHGAEECARIIKRMFGIERSAEAVRRHAYRIGASIVEHWVCTNCGRRTRKLDRDGFCPVCHQRRLAEEQRRFNEKLLDELHDSEAGPEFEKAARMYAAERRRTSYMCRKHGLQGKRARKERSGDYANCHAKMSFPSSAA